ncbi:hypothetical protein [Acidisphaera rubrifaciens]|uniref:Uncharacterized protein n=1 Tax=Acidisphaera rubrifaciens HS-AP3 TaxID=1231350 RepID=A0A0D6P579_9PROT|nr:hypothetical protein [Acidisphaera rubrifaciens]GAN76348.1 hypothetical protein Asru_0086_24 [Acidisphaera rubrifaciens HS-AP3]
MRTYARIQDRQVVELLSTDDDIATLFHPSLRWVDVTDQPGVTVGWLHDGRAATAPVVTAPEALPTIDELRLAFAQLEARLRRLAGE